MATSPRTPLVHVLPAYLKPQSRHVEWCITRVELPEPVASFQNPGAPRGFPASIHYMPIIADVSANAGVKKQRFHFTNQS
jgi:hypothetical protein